MESMAEVGSSCMAGSSISAGVAGLFRNHLQEESRTAPAGVNGAGWVGSRVLGEEAMDDVPSVRSFRGAGAS